MAINPETQYPGKIAPSTPEYPYGAARNITVPGDGTGTPWEAAIVNDLLGFQQKLLVAAGVVPSGSPDNADTSQYLEALFKVSGAAYDEVPSMVADASLKAGAVALTVSYFGGWAATIEGPSGGARYIIVTKAQHDVVRGTGTVDELGDHTLDNGDVALIYHPGGSFNVLQYGAKSSVSFDSTPGISAAIAAAGIGGTIEFPGSFAIDGTLQPLERQTWLGTGGNPEFIIDTVGGGAAFEFTSGNDFATIRNFKIRSQTGFTGQAVKYNGCLNCKLEDVLLTNLLNATAVQYSGGAFYNESNNIRITSCDVALHITGNSPSTPNNNIVDNFDIFGLVGTGLLCDGNPSMFTLNRFICEASTTTAHLKVTNAGATLIFNNPRWEGTSTPADGFFSIVDGAKVLFDGESFDIQKATHGSLVSDLKEFSKRNIFNLIQDPLFIEDFATTPVGWSVTTGSFSSITNAGTRPPVSTVGNALEAVTSAGASQLSYALSSGVVQTLARGKNIKVHGLSKFSGAGTNITLVARSEGGVSGPQSQVSENNAIDSWQVHSVELTVPDDATTIIFGFFCVGNGGVFNLWAPVLEVDGAFYALSTPTQEMPWLSNGYFTGGSGNKVSFSGAAPVAGTAKRGDRVYHTLPSAGGNVGWVCVAAGSPGTWKTFGTIGA